VLYAYNCSGCGEFDLSAPMGTASPQAPCPRCASLARRVFTAPHLGRGNNPRMRLLDATKRSAHEPQVVDSIPAAGARKPGAVTYNPRHSKLPRP
jgi:putative FmdB family regulatory protein